MLVESSMQKVVDERPHRFHRGSRFPGSDSATTTPKDGLDRQWIDASTNHCEVRGRRAWMRIANAVQYGADDVLKREVSGETGNQPIGPHGMSKHRVYAPPGPMSRSSRFFTERAMCSSAAPAGLGEGTAWLVRPVRGGHGPQEKC